MCGGVGDETIQLLSSQVTTATSSQAAADTSIAGAGSFGGQKQGERRASSSYSLGPVSPSWRNGRHAVGLGRSAWDDHGDASSTPSDPAADVPSTEAVAAAHEARSRSRPVQQADMERKATRSLMLFNLPEGATHADITSTVRGGLLLDIYIKCRDKAAIVSFLHGADAQAFFDHVHHAGLYVKNQRVDIKWHTCQFTLAGNTAHKISLGATRNLVIRHHDPNLVERQLRQDLDHIHNLVVISVQFLTGNCYISTNSVHNAVFARLCLMSRREYKGSRIEWGVDECAQSLDQMPKPCVPPRHNPAPLPAATSKAIIPTAITPATITTLAPARRSTFKSRTMNRFRLLDLE